MEKINDIFHILFIFFVIFGTVWFRDVVIQFFIEFYYSVFVIHLDYTIFNIAFFGAFLCAIIILCIYSQMEENKEPNNIQEYDRMKVKELELLEKIKRGSEK